MKMRRRKYMQKRETVDKGISRRNRVELSVYPDLAWRWPNR